jgi:hypothetical protein
MARALVIEEERGTCSGRRHPHNGYYAGDLSTSARSTRNAGLPTAVVFSTLSRRASVGSAFDSLGVP